MHTTYSQFGCTGPITVHCTTGAGRTAVFIALSIILDRMRAEHVVDVFTTVSLIRTYSSNTSSFSGETVADGTSKYDPRARSVPLPVPSRLRVPPSIRSLLILDILLLSSPFFPSSPGRPLFGFSSPLVSFLQIIIETHSPPTPTGALPTKLFRLFHWQRVTSPPNLKW